MIVILGIGLVILAVAAYFVFQYTNKGSGAIYDEDEGIQASSSQHSLNTNSTNQRVNTSSSANVASNIDRKKLRKQIKS